jgi:hypothetical protein
MSIPVIRKFCQVLSPNGVSVSTITVVDVIFKQIAPHLFTKPRHKWFWGNVIYRSAREIG